LRAVGEVVVSRADILEVSLSEDLGHPAEIGSGHSRGGVTETVKEVASSDGVSVVVVSHHAG